MAICLLFVCYTFYGGAISAFSQQDLTALLVVAIFSVWCLFFL